MEHDVKQILLDDGAGASVNLSADGDYITLSVWDFDGLAVACLSLEQVREMMGWMRQAMAKMKEAAR